MYLVLTNCVFFYINHVFTHNKIAYYNTNNKIEIKCMYIHHFLYFYLSNAIL